MMSCNYFLSITIYVLYVYVLSVGLQLVYRVVVSPSLNNILGHVTSAKASPYSHNPLVPHCYTTHTCHPYTSYIVFCLQIVLLTLFSVEIGALPLHDPYTLDLVYPSNPASSFTNRYHFRLLFLSTSSNSCSFSHEPSLSTPVQPPLIIIQPILP